MVILFVIFIDLLLLSLLLGRRNNNSAPDSGSADTARVPLPVAPYNGAEAENQTDPTDAQLADVTEEAQEFAESDLPQGFALTPYESGMYGLAQRIEGQPDVELGWIQAANEGGWQIIAKGTQGWNYWSRGAEPYILLRHAVEKLIRQWREHPQGKDRQGRKRQRDENLMNQAIASDAWQPISVIPQLALPAAKTAQTLSAW
ncbi:hypothetical protein [Leptolyngbya sp. FACHB-261]|uniref:hypothetical protein n=1 Tax=Leptolyngbya sp. FACHB-261 TaxID=2692806 RepID=UPI001684EC9E|nr:hypothetical protein [Leptolyngbya sp. FACHB-261]MBD2104117.1 hypothetical protein [Leptolyngbya sp. FACHB-261]